MKTYKELTIVMPNKPGKLAETLKAIASARINLIAIDSSSGYDLNMVRLVTSDSQKTRKTLEKLGYNVTETMVIVHVPNHVEAEKALRAALNLT
jgi:hypothetical protein